MINRPGSHQNTDLASGKPGSLWIRCYAICSWLLQGLGTLIARVVLTLFYFTLLPPFALIARLLTDPLRVGKEARTVGPQWTPIEKTATGWDESLRQG